MTPFVEWTLTLQPRRAHLSTKGRRITSVPPAARNPSTKILRSISVRAADTLSITSIGFGGSGCFNQSLYSY